jgi:hypothetical protein
MSLVIEGWWEDILRRSEEFKGRRVRLVILNEPDEDFDSSPQNQLHPLDAIVGMACSNHGSLSEDHDKGYCTIGDEKARLGRCEDEHRARAVRA